MVLNKEKIAMIRKMRSAGLSCHIVGKKLGVSSRTVWRYSRDIAVRKEYAEVMRMSQSVKSDIAMLYDVCQKFNSIRDEILRLKKDVDALPMRVSSAKRQGDAYLQELSAKIKEMAVKMDINDKKITDVYTKSIEELMILYSEIKRVSNELELFYDDVKTVRDGLVSLRGAFKDVKMLEMIDRFIELLDRVISAYLDRKKKPELKIGEPAYYSMHFGDKTHSPF